MDSSAVLGKTRKGVDELAQRTEAVSQKLRSVLILVDGKTGFAELLRKFSFMPQCDEHLAWLLQHGFIQVMPPVVAAASPVTSAAGASSGSSMSAVTAPSPRKALLTLAHELLGVNANAVVQRLQDTEDTREALAQTLERCHKLIRLSIDETKAEQFRKLGSALLVPTT